MTCSKHVNAPTNCSTCRPRTAAVPPEKPKLLMPSGSGSHPLVTEFVTAIDIRDITAPKRNRSARREPVCMSISLTLSRSVSLALRRANCARVEGTRAFHFLCLSLSLLGGLTMPEWKGRVPLTRSHCERIT
ncbi:hypothetical protein EVAR_648_1 [Eumeta japonica]|uniref:Uncharacterized protein n=1 Tax=Eumeta variegata TaxID=151549 RepID=A0A4C1SEB8_EUMVA|nr:hypothetical protein EVAR_648_1 [Eumeta japonica]